MAFETITAVALTSTAGGAVAATTGVLAGKLKKVRYVQDPTTPFTGTPSLTLTGALTGTNLLTVAAITGGSTNQEWMPQQLSNKNSDGTATTAFVDMPVGEGITLAMVAAGANKLGTLYIITGD